MLASLKKLLAKRDFALLMATQWLSQAGDGLAQGAIATLIAFGGQKGFDPESAKSPDEVLRIVLYTLIPYTLLSPFLGVLIDRWDRRRLLMVTNALRAAVVLLVGLWGSGNAPDFVLFGAFLLTLMCTRLVLATKSAALPATLDDQDLHAANGISQLGGALFQLGGLGVALIGREMVGADPVLLVGGVVYGAAAFAPSLIKRAGDKRVPESFMRELAGVVRRIAAGIAEVARKPQAGASITTYFWLRYLWSFTLVAVGFVAQGLLDSDMKIAALTGGAGAAGAVLGFIVSGKLIKRVRSIAHLVLGASALAGTAVAVLGGIGKVATLPLLTFALGLGFFLGKISLDTLVQRALGDDFRGRAFSLYDIAYNMAWLLAAGILQVTWTEGSSNGALIAGMGVVFLLGVGIIGAWFRRAGLLAQGAG